MYAAAPATISGDCHSLFQVQGRAQLALRHVRLEHSCAPAEDGDLRTVGAAVFVLNKASASLDACAVTSAHGLGLWGVQRARITADGCSLGPIGRSGVALFGAATALLSDCAVSQCGAHGACARGNASVALSRCREELPSEGSPGGGRRVGLGLRRPAHTVDLKSYYYPLSLLSLI